MKISITWRIPRVTIFDHRSSCRVYRRNIRTHRSDVPSFVPCLIYGSTCLCLGIILWSPLSRISRLLSSRQQHWRIRRKDSKVMIYWRVINRVYLLRLSCVPLAVWFKNICWVDVFSLFKIHTKTKMMIQW